LELIYAVFGLRFDEPAASNDPLAYGDPFSRYQNRTDSGFGHQEGGNTATERDVGRSGSGLSGSKVDYHHPQSGVAATPPYLSNGVDVRGSGDDQFKSAAQTGTGIFKNAFGDQWKTDLNDPLPGGHTTPHRNHQLHH
jgi:hypothetical protein